jgi:PAS domain S-box-containing protein
MPIFYKGLVLVVVPVIFELCFAGSLFASLNDAYQEKRQEQHVRALCTNACHLIILYYETGLIMNLQLGSETWNKYLETVGRINEAETKLITMTTVDPEANKLAREFVQSVGPLHEFINHSQNVVEAGGTSEVNLREAFKGRDRLEPTLIKAKDKLNALIDQVLNSAQANPDRLMHKRGDQAVLLLGGLAISFVISLGSAYFFSFAFTRRLGLLRENARRLRLGQDLLPPLQGTDELAHLDNVFRSMAASIEKLRQRQRAVFDNSSDIICTIQPSGVVSAINPACLRIWGYDPSELAGIGILSLMVESDRANAQLALLNCSDSAPAQFFEARMTRKDGTIADMLWSLSYAQSGGGLFVLTAHDITARKEMQRLKQEFISMVSQDMRAPLLEVHQATHQLVAGEIGELSEKATTQLQGVERNCERLLDLINDLLEIDKLESGEFQLSYADGSATDILKQTQNALENLAGQRGISIVIDSPADTIACDVDAKRVVQVAVNLLSNAIKFSPDNSTVTLSAVRVDDSVEISVIDHGRGIPAAMCSAVFEKYKQVESSDGKRNKGTGLGLPICKSIIEQHGGEIGVESEVGRGSRFWFRLPLKQRTAVH